MPPSPDKLTFQRRDAPVVAMRVLREAGVDISGKPTDAARPRIWRALSQSPALAARDKTALMYYIDVHARKAEVDVALIALAAQAAAHDPKWVERAAYDNSVAVAAPAAQQRDPNPAAPAAAPKPAPGRKGPETPANSNDTKPPPDKTPAPKPPAPEKTAKEGPKRDRSPAPAKEPAAPAKPAPDAVATEAPPPDPGAPKAKILNDGDVDGKSEVLVKLTPAEYDAMTEDDKAEVLDLFTDSKAYAEADQDALLSDPSLMPSVHAALRRQLEHNEGGESKASPAGAGAPNARILTDGDVDADSAQLRALTPAQYDAMQREDQLETIVLFMESNAYAESDREALESGDTIPAVEAALRKQLEHNEQNPPAAP